MYDIPIAANNNNIVNLFNALEGKAKAFYGLYQEQGAKKDLLAAFQSYDFLCNFIHQMRKSYKTESSKLNLSKKAGMAYAEAIDVACLLHDFSKAFHFLEQSKAALMLENMQDIEVFS